MRISPPRTRRPDGRYRTYFVSVLMSVLGLLLYVWCHVESLAQGEHLAALRRTKDELINEQKMLKAEIVGLQRSGRIRKLAGRELGMRFPEESPGNLYLDPAEGAPVDGSRPVIATQGATRAR